MKTRKILSIIAAALIPYPLIITSLAGTYKTAMTPATLLWFIYGLISMALGTFTGRWSANANGKMIYAAKLTTVFSGAVCTVICVPFIWLCQMNSFAYIFITSALCMWYILGYRNGQGRELLNNMLLGGFCVESALLFPLCKSACNDSFVLLIIAALVMVITMVVINRRQLERLSERGKNETAVISAASRKFNLKLTLIFAALILVPFFFASYGGDIIWELVKIIVRFLLSLFSFSEENIDAETEIGSLPIPEGIERGDNLWLQIVMAIIVAAGLVLLINPFIKAVKKLIKRIGTALGKKTDSVQKEAVYTDYYEESGNGKKSDTSFKKAYKAFQKEKDPRRKYRLGYRAFMIRSAELGAEPSPSDTTAVHRKKRYEVGTLDFTDDIIDKYERVRYRDEETEMEDCEIMDKALKKIGGKR